MTADIVQTKIHPKTRIGAISLTVTDLERSVTFYQQVLGLKLHSLEDGSAWLGTKAVPELLNLVELSGAKRTPGKTGLYHMAFIVPSRKALARIFAHLLQTNWRLQGAADHLVSEALYLADPDDNGIEIYRDRPRETWTARDGQIQMATDPLDAEGILAEIAHDSEPWHGIDPDTHMGHIHLKVSNIPEAQSFYCDVIGFDLVTRYGPSAAFVSAGGYHHHLGMNTWESAGAPAPEKGAVGLRYFEIQLPTQDDLEQLTLRLRNAEWPYHLGQDGLVVADPSGNAIHFNLGK
jgi:catechol 2,3-dioxygenase